MDQEQLRQELETYMDLHGSDAAIDLLVSICDSKADHLRTNWQDEGGARLWEKLGRALHAAGFKYTP